MTMLSKIVLSVESSATFAYLRALLYDLLFSLIDYQIKIIKSVFSGTQRIRTPLKIYKQMFKNTLNISNAITLFRVRKDICYLPSIRKNISCDNAIIIYLWYAVMLECMCTGVLRFKH